MLAGGRRRAARRHHRGGGRPDLRSQHRPTIEVQSRLSGRRTCRRTGAAACGASVVDYAETRTRPAYCHRSPATRCAVRQKFERAEDKSVHHPGRGRQSRPLRSAARRSFVRSVSRAPGGETREAYAPGVIFQPRKRAQAREQPCASAQQAQELELGLAAAMQTVRRRAMTIEDGDIDRRGQASMRREDLIGELKRARSGRPASRCEADPDVLAAHPEDDILLEAGGPRLRAAPAALRACRGRGGVARRPRLPQGQGAIRLYARSRRPDLQRGRRPRLPALSGWQRHAARRQPAGTTAHPSCRPARPSSCRAIRNRSTSCRRRAMSARFSATWRSPESSCTICGNGED